MAFLLRDALAQLGLESFAKTSGSKGIQVYVPLNVDGGRLRPRHEGALATRWRGTWRRSTRS